MFQKYPNNPIFGNPALGTLFDVYLTALPDGFKIVATYELNGESKTAEFTVANKTGGSGTEAAPYTWSIPNLPTGTVVTFTESGYDPDDVKALYTITTEKKADGEKELWKQVGYNALFLENIRY